VLGVLSPGRFPGRAFAMAAVMLAALFALPCWLRLVEHDGRVRGDLFHLTWWAVGLLPVACEVIRHAGRRARRRAAGGWPAAAARRAVRRPRVRVGRRPPGPDALGLPRAVPPGRPDAGAARAGRGRGVRQPEPGRPPRRPGVPPLGAAGGGRAVRGGRPAADRAGARGRRAVRRPVRPPGAGRGVRRLRLRVLLAAHRSGGRRDGGRGVVALFGPTLGQVRAFADAGAAWANVAAARGRCCPRRWCSGA
jgi:hypothetical protein